MKICFLTSPASIHSYRWVKYFADKGHDIHWICLGFGGENTLTNTTFHRLKRVPGRPLRPMFYLAGIKAILNRTKPDIFHAHQTWIDGILGAASGYRPFVLTVWGSDILLGRKSRVKRPLTKFALGRADAITCDAEHMKQAMVELGTPAEKIHIINFGTDVNQFSPGPKNQDLIKELSIANSPVVISLRSLRPLYDVESLIKAAPSVLQRVPEAKFIVAGEGEEKDRLVSMATSLGVLPSVRFVGSIPSNRMPEYLRLADVYVSTSLSDAGIAASTAEAMACGLPVLVTDFGDNRKWVEDGENGYLVPLRAPDAIAERIVNLLQNEDQRHSFGRANRQIIQERNNWAVEMSKVHNLYDELAKDQEGVNFASR